MRQASARRAACILHPEGGIQPQTPPMRTALAVLILIALLLEPVWAQARL